MSKPRTVTFIFALGLVATASAQTPPSTAPARSTELVVTPNGAFERVTSGHAPRSPAPGAQALTAPGLLWSHADGGQAWIGTTASIGERGTQVFTEYDINNEAVELFSTFDSDPPTAVWSDPTALGTEEHMVDSAEATDAHVAIHQKLVSGPFARQAVVRKYRSGSATPEWTYTFAPVINSSAKVGISRNGQKIVAALTNNNTWDIEIAVFGSTSSTPQSYTKVPVGANSSLRGFDLSADGSTLYFSAGVTAYVFDVASASVVFSTSIGATFDSHAISGDGSVFAFGSFNVMRVFERSGGSYISSFNANRTGEVYCARIDISDDGSTVASGWYFYNPGLTVVIEARDIASKSLTMAETLTGTGSFQNVVSDVSCSADGSRFAVGLWGDEGGLVAEVRIYARDQVAPLVTFNTPGSVFDVDLSADGQRIVAASKAVHANQLGSGGRVDLVDAGGEDFVLRGRPSISEVVEFRLYGQPLKNAYLLTSLGQAIPPVVYPSGIGTLYIDRSSLTIEFMSQVQANGQAQGLFVIANEPSLIGKSLFFQGLTVSPRRLTKDWVKMTILP